MPPDYALTPDHVPVKPTMRRMSRRGPGNAGVPFDPGPGVESGPVEGPLPGGVEAQALTVYTPPHRVEAWTRMTRRRPFPVAFNKASIRVPTATCLLLAYC